MSLLDALPAQRLWEMSDEEFWAYTRELASVTTVAPDLTRAQAAQYLECVLSEGTCLLPLSAIEEVLPSPQRYTPLPASPGWMPGLAVWHGEVMAVVNFEAYLAGHHSGDVPCGGLLLCAHFAGLALGLCVPAVGRTVTLDDAGDTPVLDGDELLADITRQIGMAAHDA